MSNVLLILVSILAVIGFYVIFIVGTGLWQSLTKKGPKVTKRIESNGWKGAEAESHVKFKLNPIFDDGYRPSFWIAIGRMFNRIFGIGAIIIALILFFKPVDSGITFFFHNTVKSVGFNPVITGIALLVICIPLSVFIAMSILGWKADRRRYKMLNAFIDSYFQEFGKPE